MCYICEQRGTVGKRYRETQREIDLALRAWRQKPADLNLEDVNQCLAWLTALRRKDWSKRP